MTLNIQVPPTYPEGAKLVVVGEAPGREEVDAKTGFVGAAGRCLQRACGIAGLDWAHVARTNLAKRRPGENHNNFREAFYQTIEEPVYTPKGNLSKRTRKVTLWTPEYEEWLDLLAGELRGCNPNLVVAAGNEALTAITGLSGITNYRGSVVSSRGPFTRQDGTPLKVLAVEHPSFIIRGGMTEFWVLAHDLKKAKREAEFPEIRRETWQEFLVSNGTLSLTSIVALLHGIAEVPTAKWTLDVETRAGTLACLAIACRAADGGIFSFCIPIQTSTGPYWSPEDELEIWRAMNETLQSNPNLCNQNIEYDIYYLLRYGCEPSGVWMDTMLAHALLYPEFPKGLDFLCSFYLDEVVYYKGEGRDWKAGDRDEDLWKYNVKDAVFTLRVVEKIDEELRKRGWWEAYHGSGR